MNRKFSGIIGAMIGDIVGSVYEFNNTYTKDFPLFRKGCYCTDDSVMTIAVARALKMAAFRETYLSLFLVMELKTLGEKYPNVGYGGMFRKWLKEDEFEPYNSLGNGSAMRVSPCGFYADSLKEALYLAEMSAEVTHNHPEGIKGAQATAAAIYLARTGSTKEEIKNYIEQNFYSLDFTVDDLRPYPFNETCMKTVPQSIVCFLESENYEDAVRNAVSIGGDSDTIACITGGIAWAYYSAGKDELPEDMLRIALRAMEYIPTEFLDTIIE